MLYNLNGSELTINNAEEAMLKELTTLVCERINEKLSNIVEGEIYIGVGINTFTVNICKCGTDFYCEVTNVWDLASKAGGGDIISARILSRYKRFIQELFFK